MTGLHFYSSTLTPVQVWRAYKEGPCSKGYFSSGLLTEVILGWADILKLARPATVTEIYISSDNSNLLDLLNLTPEMTSQLVKELKKELTTEIRSDDGLLQEIRENITEEIKKNEEREERSYWDILADFVGGMVTNGLLGHLAAKQPDD